MPEPTDPADQPDDPQDPHELLYPFIVCTSAGGPYDDNTFTAGFQLGALDQALCVAAALDMVDTVARLVFTTLVAQAELVGMARGFATMTADESDQPAWTLLTFTRTTPDSGGIG